jgi:hypothetical protein
MPEPFQLEKVKKGLENSNIKPSKGPGEPPRCNFFSSLSLDVNVKIIRFF